jgi:aryl-alcohol dehydrogenase-like predicted oxidoreductase
MTLQKKLKNSCINWLLNQPDVTAPNIEVPTMEQLEASLGQRDDP